MTRQFFDVHVRGVQLTELVILLHICALVNEVPNFFRVVMMPPTAEEDPF
jgi:hypothetical protein